MKKHGLSGLLILILAFLVFNVLAFAVPFAHTATFWFAYSFGMIALLMQGPVFYVAFKDGELAKSYFYGYPIARIGIIYLGIQILVSIVAMIAAAILPAWIIALVSVIMLAAMVAGMIATDTMREEIDRQDEKLKTSVSFIRALQAKLASVCGQTEDAELSALVNKLLDEVRFSDPVSSEALHGVEADITSCIDELQSAVVDGDIASATTLCKKASLLVAERNRLCKLNK